MEDNVISYKSCEQKLSNERSQKLEKVKKKFLTKARKCDKLKKLCDECGNAGAQQSTKEFDKNLKKVLDKFDKMC